MKKEFKIDLIVISLLIVIISTCIIFSQNNTKKKEYLLKIDHYDELDSKQEEVMQEKDLTYIFKDFLLQEGKILSLETVTDESFLDIISFIKKELNVNLDNKWKYFVNISNTETKSGTISLNYYINDEIGTDKSITIAFSNKTITKLYYMCLDKEVDEIKVINKVNEFKKKYTQEKVKLKENEFFNYDETNYQYFYNIDTLVYNYSVSTYYMQDGYKSYGLGHATRYIIK